MPVRTRKAAPSAPVALVFGEDDLAVQQRGRALFQAWSAELGGMDHETVAATAQNSAEALTALGRLREALHTLPFFGGGKVVWFKDCNFLGTDRTSEAGAVAAAVAELGEELGRFAWDNVRLVITAGKVDKRKAFFKGLQKLGTTEEFGGWSVDDRDWEQRARELLREQFAALGKAAGEEVLEALTQAVGPNPRQLALEAEKLALYALDQPRLTAADVAAISIRNKQARAFALAEAVGDRDLPRALAILDEELWTMQFDRKRSEIGLLYGLIHKVRSLLMVKEMMAAGWIRPVRSYPELKAQLERVPTDDLPADKRLNPLALNPFVIYKALPQTRHFTSAELVAAMDRLLEGNRQLVSSASEERLVLQQVLVDILGRAVAA